MNKILNLSNKLTETIKKFVIPRKKDKKDLLQKLEDENDKDEIKEVEKIILDSFFNKECKFDSLGYSKSEVFLVNNANTNQIYEEKRSEMRKANDVTLSDIFEKNLFYVCEDFEEVQQITSEGFKCIETKDGEKNILGTSEMGIHFSKNADIVLKNQYKNRSRSFYVIIAKVSITKNKARLVIPSIQNIQNDADPNYEYHISRGVLSPENDVRKQFYDSLIYIYEYDELGEHIEKPRNILPYAVLHCERKSIGLNEKQMANKQKAVVKQKIKKQPKQRPRRDVPGSISKEDQIQDNLSYIRILNPHSIRREEDDSSKKRITINEHLQRQSQPALLRRPQIEQSYLIRAPNSNQQDLNKAPHLEKPNFNRRPQIEQHNLIMAPNLEQLNLNKATYIEQSNSNTNNTNIRTTLTNTNNTSANNKDRNQKDITSLNIIQDAPINTNNISYTNKTNVTIDSNTIDDINIVQVEDQFECETVEYVYDSSEESDSDIEEIVEHKPSIYSDDDTDSEEEKDLLTLFDEWYGDLYTEENLNEKIPRWRMHYEMTGRMDIRFRAAPRTPSLPKCNVIMPDVTRTFKFADMENTRVNLADPTNQLILACSNKKNQSVVNASTSKSYPTLKRNRDPSPNNVPIDSHMTKVQKIDDKEAQKKDEEAQRKLEKTQKVREALQRLQAKRKAKRERDEAQSILANVKQEPSI